MRLLIALALVSLAPPPARACTPARCVPGRISPADGARVPANAALHYLPDEERGPGSSPLPQTIELREAGGAVVAIDTVEDSSGPGLLVVPRAPLAKGEYQLTRAASCTAAVGAVTTGFSVGDAAPLPTRLGAVSLGATTRGTVKVPTSSGSCYEDVPAVSASVTLSPSSELEPHLAVTKFRLLVDGASYAESPYGAVEWNGFATAPQVTYLAARCDGQPGWLAPGRHHASLSAHVAGAASDAPPIEFDFTLDCPGAGCSVAARAPASPFVLLLAFVLGFALRRRVIRL